MSKGYFAFLLILMSWHPSLFSQKDSADIYDLDFIQLSKLKVTTVSKAPRTISEVPSTIYIITAADIKERGYFTLDEALSDLPGFQFRNILGFNSYVFQRGLTNQNNLILLLIDGVQVNELNSGGFYGGGQYLLENVDRIEVVYGPASVAYGTNAVTGIINIITKSATEKQAELSATAGSFRTTEAEAAYCYANKEKTIGVRFAGMVKKTAKADLQGAAGDNNWTDLMDNFENDYSADLKVQFKNFTLGTNYLLKEASTATWQKSTGTIYRDYGTSWNIQFLNNYLRYSKNLSRDLTLYSTLYNRNATVLGNTVYYVVDTAQVGYYRPNNLTGFENVLNYSSGGLFSCTGGLLFEYEQLAKYNTFSYSNSPDVRPPEPGKPPMDRNTLGSIFIEPRMVLFKDLFLSAGLRFDQSSIYDQVLTPRAGVVYNLGRHILRFSYAQAFRAPKPWDYTDGLGNSSLLPEKMRSFEGAVTLSLPANLSMDLIGYLNALENAISKQNLPAGYKWINEGKVKTTGFEVFIRYNSGQVRSSLNYTFNQSTNQKEEPVPEISKHSGNASITWSNGKHLKLNLRANYTGERKNPKLIACTQSYYIEPCVIFHGALSLLNYDGFSIQLIVKNILNTEYYHTSNKAPDRYRQPQRTLLLTVGYSLKTK